MGEKDHRLAEQITLQERGELTLAHWEEVLRRIGTRENAISAKIVAYAQKVMSGEFPDTGLHHRRFLGRRHWDLLCRLDVTDEVRIPRRFLPWKKTLHVVNGLASQVVNYASHEKNAHFTLDDYIECTRGYFANFDFDGVRWTETSLIEEEEWEAGHYFKTGRFYKSRTHYDRYNIGRYWLLKDNELPGELSLFALESRLREIARSEPEEVQNRLKEGLALHQTCCEIEKWTLGDPENSGLEIAENQFRNNSIHYYDFNCERLQHLVC